MRLQWLLMAAVVTGLLAPAAARADGLLYAVPAVGAKAVYDMKLTSERGGKSVMFSGSLSVACVGSEKVDGKPCRWIEVQMTMEMQGMSRTITAKLLIPEASLGKGKTPLDAVQKGWIKMGDNKAGELKDPKGRSGGPLPAFFPGPLKDVKELTAAKIKTEYGELECKGITGATSYTQGGSQTDVTYETRLNDKSPTGVATCKMTIKVTRNGKIRETAVLELKLNEVVKKGAKSALPKKK